MPYAPPTARLLQLQKVPRVTFFQWLKTINAFSSNARKRKIRVSPKSLLGSVVRSVCTGVGRSIGPFKRGLCSSTADWDCVRHHAFCSQSPPHSVEWPLFARACFMCVQPNEHFSWGSHRKRCSGDRCELIAYNTFGEGGAYCLIVAAFL